MTILVCTTSSGNKLTSIKVNDKGQRTAIVQTVNNVVDPLPLSVSSDPSQQKVSTDWIVRHPIYNLVYVLTNFGNNKSKSSKAKAMLTTYRVYTCGTLEYLSVCPSGGYQACHASINPNGTTLAIAHLNCGHVAFFNVQEDGGCNGPPFKMIRLPVLFPNKLIEPHDSITGVGVPGAHGVCYSPNGEFVVMAEPSQHAVFTYKCDARNGHPQTMEAYKSKKGLPLSNSAFSHVQTETELDAVGWWQQISILLGGDWGPRVRRAVIHPNGKYLYALQDQSNSIVVYELEHEGMILPRQLQELKVAELELQKECWIGMSTTTATDLQAFEDGLILSVKGEGGPAELCESGIRIIHYTNDGAWLKIGQHIETEVPVTSFVCDTHALWIGFDCEAKPYVQKFQKAGPYRDEPYDPMDDDYTFSGQANIGMSVSCLVSLNEAELPEKPKHAPQPASRSLAPLSSSSMPPQSSQPPPPIPGMDNRMIRKAKLRAAFLNKDADGSGFLEPEEVAEVLEKMGEPCSPNDVKEFMEQADKDNDGKLDFEEFFAFAERKHKESMTPEMIKRRKLAAAFHAKDDDGSGFLDADEIAEILADMGQACSPDQVTEFVKTIDKDGDGRIDFEEFYAFATRTASPEEVRRNKLRAAFHRKDDDGSGFLDATEIAEVLAGMGQPASPRDVEEFMKTMDKDGDGQIDFEEFYAFATRELTPEEARRQKLKAAFDKKDDDGSGFLDADEIAEVLAAMGQSATPAQVEQFMKTIDEDGDGRIDFEEFYAFATGQTTSTTNKKKKPSPEEQRRKKLKAAFDKKDDDGSGYLEAQEVAEVLAGMGQAASPEAVKEFMKTMDQDGDGKIDFEEFYAFATGATPTPPPKKKKNKDDKRRKLKKAFDAKDDDGSGYLEAEEVSQVLAGMGQLHSPDAVKEFMKTMDQDGDGRIDFEEFYAFATGATPQQAAKREKASKPKKGSPEDLKRRKLKKAFDAKDDDGSGYLEAQEIAEVLAASGEPCEPEDVKKFIQNVDQDGDGKINFEEFYAFATGKTTKKKEEEEETEERKKLRAAFNKRDKDGSGYLEEPEITKILAGMGQPTAAKDVADFIKAIDKDGDGKINFEEFCVFATRTKSGGGARPGLSKGGKSSRKSSSSNKSVTEESEERKKLRAAFEKRDKDGSGYLEEPEITKILAGMGQPASNKDVADFIKAIDKDGDGKINFEEFCVFATRTAKKQQSKRSGLMSKSKSSKSMRSRSKSRSRAADDDNKSVKSSKSKSSGKSTKPSSSSKSIKEQPDLNDPKVKKFKAAFDKRDKDGSGFLEAAEMAKVLEGMGQPADEAAVAEFVKTIDKDGDGKINFAEFLRFAERASKAKSKRNLKGG